MESVFGQEIGMMFRKEHEDNGVIIEAETRVESFQGKRNKLTGVKLANGKTIQADLVILGTGVQPATSFLKSSGVDIDQSGAVTCDTFLKTSNKDVFAAGDIVSFPYWPTGERTRVEHWAVALDQGTYAAFNMMGKLVPYSSIPFFWTRHYNKSV